MVYCGDSSFPGVVLTALYDVHQTDELVWEGLRWSHLYAWHLDGYGSTEAGLSWDC